MALLYRKRILEGWLINDWREFPPIFLAVRPGLENQMPEMLCSYLVASTMINVAESMASAPLRNSARIRSFT